MKLVNGLLLALWLSLSLSFCRTRKTDRPVWKSDNYSVYADSIVEGPYVAKALNDSSLVSNYKSPANAYQSANIEFKFSINGKDDEMRPGMNHRFTCMPNADSCATPVIKFGTPLAEAPVSGQYLAPNTRLTIRVDMREVLAAFKNKGYYTTYKGDKIYKQDFKGLYVAGNTAPLIWDFDNLVHHPSLQLKDPDNDGIYETTLTLNAAEDKRTTNASWTLSKDISAFPQYHSGYPIADALYNLSLEEMIRAVEPDSTFRTGREWAGVWTRDISYSILLSMAYLQPRVARYSLLRKVNGKKKIIQDTGTGGAWPVSTDRMIWAVAAWELYKATGDMDWLKEAYTIIKNSIDDDLPTIYDAQTGLVHGESSFLDWREQTYPKWMQPADIFESENLGTNAVHYEANIVLSRMAGILGDTAEATRHEAIAQKIKAGINKYLWQPSRQYYGQYLYGRHYKILSPRSEALGEALCVLFGIADSTRAEEIISHVPVTAYGISCIYPQIPDIPPYHNNAVWPFVQSFWLWAAARAGNEQAVMESISAIYRPAALFATNKENFVADNGDFEGTQINSGNMLWSLSGNLSIIHKVIFGIHFTENGLRFSPFVPKAWQGKRSLTHFKYRDAMLNIEMEGYGNRIHSFVLDGRPVKDARLPTGLKGTHHIRIVLANNTLPRQPVHNVSNYFSPPTPLVSLQKDTLSWLPDSDAQKYEVLENGSPLRTIYRAKTAVDQKGFSEYQVIRVDENEVKSFASEPIPVFPAGEPQIFEVENYAGRASYPYHGFSGKGFTEVSTTLHKKITIPIIIIQSGLYAIDCRYANGNGPTNTENKCAIRSLLIDSRQQGVFVLPQRGKDEWSNWGFSNPVRIHLEKGRHLLSIEYLPFNENMNGDINQAMLDYVRITAMF